MRQGSGELVVSQVHISQNWESLSLCLLPSCRNSPRDICGAYHKLLKLSETSEAPRCWQGAAEVHFVEGELGEIWQ